MTAGSFSSAMHRASFTPLEKVFCAMASTFEPIEFLSDRMSEQSGQSLARIRKGRILRKFECGFRLSPYFIVHSGNFRRSHKTLVAKFAFYPAYRFPSLPFLEF